MMQRLSLLLAALAATARVSAKTTATTVNSTVINVHLPTAVGSQAVMGSVVAVDATATSYFLTCPTSEPLSDCGLGDGFEFVEGPSVLEIHMTEAVIGTIDVSCGIASNTASCTTTLVTVDYDIQGTSTASSTVTSSGSAVVTDISSYTMPVTVTAGLDKLTSNTTSTAGVARNTQNAMLAGAAAIIGGALLI